MANEQHVIWLDRVGNEDTARVGGKHASLGEMIQNLADAGIGVSPGFATTADAYREFVRHNDLDARLRDRLSGLGDGDVADVVDVLRRLGGGRKPERGNSSDDATGGEET